MHAARMTRHALVMLITVLPGVWSATVLAQPHQRDASPPQRSQDAHSLCMPTGPPPEGGYQSYADALNLRAGYMITGVPAYIWRHGCGPTACGMVIGYWDMHGFPSLIPGSAASQTASVNDAIASGDYPCGATGTNHYNDYSCPVDDVGPIQADTSELGGSHTPSHCLGDFARTSWSVDGMRYGWSYLSWIDDALRGYVDYANASYGSSYTRTSSNQNWSSSLWNSYRTEINNDRPVVFLVDTDGDGATDHFVTGIGWRDDSGFNEYACFDTWGTGVRWERFRGMSVGDTWGIYAMTYFRIQGGENDCNNNGIVDEDDISLGSSEDCNSNGVPDECDEALVITVHPQNQRPCPGHDATFTVTAPGATAYQPGFPRWSAADGMIRACFTCDSRVSGHFDRGIPWVTGENEHFVFSLTAISSSGSTARRSRATRAYSRFVNWTRHSV